jgi:hypothetical protein
VRSASSTASPARVAKPSPGAGRRTGSVPLPEWGSASASSRYGLRACITSAAEMGKFGRTPHNTTWGGCGTVPVKEKEGIESNRCSLGNPLNRSWRYENSAPQRTPGDGPPMLLGRRSSHEAPPLVGNDKRHVHFA